MELMNNLSSIATNVTIPKLIEFPEHFILNTQLYNKQTLKPVPMKFYVNNDLNNPFMLLQTSIIKTNYFITYCFNQIQNNNEHNHQNIIQDKNDPTIFYVLQKLYNGYDYMCFYKIQYNDSTKQYDILRTFKTTESGLAYPYKGDIKILYETDKYFIISVTGQHHASYDYNDSSNGNSGYGFGIYSINKETFSCITLIKNQSTYGFCYLLESNDDTIYVLKYYNYYTLQIIKINISAMTATSIWTYATAQRGVFCNPVKIGNYNYVLIPYSDGTVYTYKIMKISLDMSTDTINTELFDINLNGFILDNSPSTDIIYHLFVRYTLRVIKTNTDIYISCLMHEVPNSVNYAYQHKHVLLKFNDTSFTVTDVIPLIDGCCGSLEYNDSKHQIFYMLNCVLFYTFDETKEKMVCTYRKGGLFMEIGFDSLNRFITQTYDGNIEILTETNACILNADFDEEIYDKEDGIELDTTVSFYAKNFLDEYFETNVKLSLRGPVVFKENNTKELITTTSKDKIKTVPVTINGYGNIEVIITQNT